MSHSEEIFSPDGLLSKSLDGFRYRSQQQSMGVAVESSLQHNSQLIIEAGTGVGKTFAYLIPALLSGQKVVISTGTKHLQDQLYFKDLPTVLEILKLPVSTALLKGRANYLCLHRLEQHAPRAEAHTRRFAGKLQMLKEWSLATKSGEIAEVTRISEDDAIWPNVTSTVENCLGAECPSYQKCHVVKARKNAQKADVIIINHHLFFADLALKEEGFGELLPSADAFIFDEAHQLPELASTFFASTVSSRQFKDLVNDVVAAQLDEAPDSNEVREVTDALQKSLADFHLTLAGNIGRKPWHEVVSVVKIEDQFDALCKSVNTLSDALLELSDRGKELMRCAERCERIEKNLQIFSEETEGVINWLENFKLGFKLHSTPLVVADSFQAFMQRYQCSWIFTSATLAVNEKFDHFQQQLGLIDAETIMLDSPYDYETNTRLFLPAINLEPNDKNYTVAVVDAVLPLLEVNQGRAFLLFTSHRALRIAANHLQDHDDFTLFVQGEAPRRELLSGFAKTEHAVLLGTSSFWEGVDIRGNALSCVVIDKLPFAAPDDPVLAGRLQALRQTGANPFMAYQLPQAVIALKQGVGRLMRDEEDYGVIVLCDPRLMSKPYGKTFIKSLPKIPLTSNLDNVINFLQLRETSSHNVQDRLNVSTVN